MSTVPTSLDRLLDEGIPTLLGVVNVTPDSFSDAGAYLSPEAACSRVDELLEQGAKVLDLGGESTRPGFTPVPAQEQIRRIEAPLRHAVAHGALVSVDTTDPEVARFGLETGATIINDVSCVSSNVLPELVAKAGAWLLIMHARKPMSAASGYAGTPEDAYQDVVAEVKSELLAAVSRAERSGVSRKRMLLDPGLGFNKSARHSAELVRRLGELVGLGFPIVVGPSRKSFLVAEVQTPARQRVGGTAAACIASVANGAALLRVHDVLDVRQALAVARAVGLLPNAARPEAAHV